MDHLNRYDIIYTYTERSFITVFVSREHIRVPIKRSQEQFDTDRTAAINIILF